MSEGSALPGDDDPAGAEAADLGEDLPTTPYGDPEPEADPGEQTEPGVGP